MLIASANIESNHYLTTNPKHSFHSFQFSYPCCQGFRTNRWSSRKPLPVSPIVQSLTLQDTGEPFDCWCYNIFFWQTESHSWYCDALGAPGPISPDDVDTQPMLETPGVPPEPSPLKVQSFEETSVKREKYQRGRGKSPTIELHPEVASGGSKPVPPEPVQPEVETEKTKPEVL